MFVYAIFGSFHLFLSFLPSVVAINLTDLCVPSNKIAMPNIHTYIFGSCFNFNDFLWNPTQTSHLLNVINSNNYFAFQAYLPSYNSFKKAYDTFLIVIFLLDQTSSLATVTILILLLNSS